MTVDHIMHMQSPGKWYSYRVHGGRIMRFQAPPPAGRKEGFQFLVYGDMGDPDHRKAKAPGWVAQTPEQRAQVTTRSVCGMARCWHATSDRVRCRADALAADAYV